MVKPLMKTIGFLIVLLFVTIAIMCASHFVWPLLIGLTIGAVIQFRKETATNGR